MLERRMWALVNLVNMQFGFMPGQETMDRWRMLVIVTVCALFRTSHCDVKFTFQIQRFAEVC